MAISGRNPCHTPCCSSLRYYLGSRIRARSYAARASSFIPLIEPEKGYNDYPHMNLKDEIGIIPTAHSSTTIEPTLLRHLDLVSALDKLARPDQNERSYAKYIQERSFS